MAPLAFFMALVMGFFFGNSISRRTRFWAAKVSNSGLENTSFFSLMHQPHQSEPVKLTRMTLLSLRAAAWASFMSVSQLAAVAPCASARANRIEEVIFSFIVRVLSTRARSLPVRVL